ILSDIIVMGSSNCIDGISISKSNNYQIGTTLYKLNELGSLNFTGKFRPQLSVDRISITSIPNELYEHAEIILSDLIEASLSILNEHIDKHEVNLESQLFNVCLERIFNKFIFFNDILMRKIFDNKISTLPWPILNENLNINISVRDLFFSGQDVIIKPNNKKLNSVTRSLLYSKLNLAHEIHAFDDGVKIKPIGIIDKNIICKVEDEDFGRSLFSADKWDVSNKEYDIITSLLPIIPKKLFDIIVKNQEEINHTGNTVRIQNYNNSIASFFDQDPLMIHPQMGIFYEEDRRIRRQSKKTYSNIFNFQKNRGRLFISEINPHEMTKGNKIIWLYVYVSNEILTDLDLLEIRKIKNQTDYIEGVHNGWSILITGMDDCDKIIKSGKRDRNELVRDIPISFWEKYHDYSFEFTDGTPVNCMNYSEID
ncbi:hypothetical protein, partial [Photobacterium kishitanii]